MCQQLKLDAEQTKTVAALIAVYSAEVEEEKKDPAGLMQRIMDKYAEVRAADAAGNTELVAKLKAELNEMRPGVKPENNFFESLSQSLTAEQKATLAQVRERAAKADVVPPPTRDRAATPVDTAPSPSRDRAANTSQTGLRPVHVLRAARRLDLTPEQQRQLEQTLDNFRTSTFGGRTRASPDDVSAKVGQLVTEVRAFLTPEQAQKYDAEIAALRASAPPPQPVRIPGMSPTSGPATRPSTAPATRPAAPRMPQ
jgi:hypothetical protein